ncbi:histidine kinase [Flavobacterium sp.]|uniref:tetratricopeptide repeat-containing sensor histidine kinase n=1 Tax=Flavobacterium sp. TaxID=239 RepID=UPI003528FEF9
MKFLIDCFLLKKRLLLGVLFLIHFIVYTQEKNNEALFNESSIYLKNNQFSQYASKLKQLESYFLKRKDSTNHFKTIIKQIELFSIHNPNKDSVQFYLTKLKKWANFYQKPYFNYNYDFINASKLSDNGKYVEALAIFQKLEPLLKNKQYPFIPNYYDAYAKQLYLLGDYEKAFDKLKISARGFELQKNLVNSSASYNNLGILYKNRKQWDSSLFYHQKSLQINLQLKDSVNISKSYNNIATTYKHINNYNKTEENLKKAIQFAPKNYSDGLVINYADLLIIQNKYNEAERLLTNMKNKTLTVEHKKGAFERLAIINKNKENYKTALAYTDSVILVSNEILNETKIKEIEKLKTTYETKEKEAEIQLLKQKAQLQTEKNNTKLILTIAIIVLLIGLIGIVFFRSRYKQRKLELDKITLEQKVLRSQMNPHFIFNVLTSIQNTVMTNNPLSAATYISRFAKLIRQNFEFIQKEFIPLSEDIDALKNYLLTQQLRFENKFEFEFHLDQNLLPDKIKVPPMMLQPFLENAIEHGLKNSSKKGKIDVFIKNKSSKQIQFIVTDNGKGYMPNKKDTQDHALKIFKKRLQLHKSTDVKTFTIKNRNEGGTIVSFCLTYTTDL